MQGCDDEEFLSKVFSSTNFYESSTLFVSKIDGIFCDDAKSIFSSRCSISNQNYLVITWPNVNLTIDDIKHEFNPQQKKYLII